MFPNLLQPGDGIGIIAPSGPVEKTRLEPAVEYLTNKGFSVTLGDAVYKRDRYLAGPDSDRLANIHAMFTNPDIKAIITARGGYGCARLLDRLDYELIRKNPKILVGFSDTTALQLAIYARTGLVTFSGITLCHDCTIKGLDELTSKYFWALLETGKFSSVDNLNVIKPGVASGPLIGGCLSIIVSLIGTPYLPDFTNSILVLEDVNEEPYRIDRMLTQLRHAGIFQQVNGLIFGQFEGCQAENHEDGTLEPLFNEIAKYVNGPVLTGLQYGHDISRVVLPIGMTANLSILENAGTLCIVNYL